MPIAMSVNMLRLRLTSDCQPRTKNGQPAHSTTGVLRANCIQREGSPSTQVGAFGSRCAIATTNTGSVRAPPIQKRRVMSRSSAFSSSLPATAFFGSSVIPQIGQLPG